MRSVSPTLPEPFLGRLQVMNPYIDASMVSYRDGDLAGLAALGAARFSASVTSWTPIGADRQGHAHDPASGPSVVIA